MFPTATFDSKIKPTPSYGALLLTHYMPVNARFPFGLK
jgi:hypothetical protein